MRTLLFTLGAWCTLSLPAQPLFHRAYDTGLGEARRIARTTDGSTYVASMVSGIGDAEWTRFGISLVKYDADYGVMWAQVLRNPVHNGDLDVQGLTATADGGVAVVGEKYKGSTDTLLVVKVQADGTVAWAQGLPVPLPAGNTVTYPTQGSSVAEAANGDLVVTGFCSHTPGGLGNTVTTAVVARFNGTGAPLWTRTLEAGGNTRAYDAIALSDGGIGVLGCTSTNAPWLARLQADGTLEWARKYALPLGQFPPPMHRLFSTPTGFDLYLPTSSAAASLGCLAHVDASGTFTEGTVYRLPGLVPYSADITPMAGGGYLLLGGAYTAGDVAYRTDLQALRVGADDAVQWSVALGSTGSEDALTVAATADGGALLGGMAFYHDLEDYRGINQRPLLVRVGADGSFAGCGAPTTAVATDTLLTTTDHTLVQTSLSSWAPATVDTRSWIAEVPLCMSTGMAEGTTAALPVAPNPASTTLRIPPLDGNNWSHTLMDATGRVLLRRTGAVGTVELDVSGVAPGWYALHSTNGRAHHRTAVLVAH